VGLDPKFAADLPQSRHRQPARRPQAVPFPGFERPPAATATGAAEGPRADAEHRAPPPHGRRDRRVRLSTKRRRSRPWSHG